MSSEDRASLKTLTRVVGLAAEVAVVHLNEVKALAVLVVGVPYVNLVEVALVVVDGGDVLTRPPLPVSTEYVHPLVLQKSKGGHSNVVGLTVPAF
jgi:hypothetical protein